jgi:hypothetical protein
MSLEPPIAYPNFTFVPIAPTDGASPPGGDHGNSLGNVTIVLIVFGGIVGILHLILIGMIVYYIWKSRKVSEEADV